MQLQISNNALTIRLSVNGESAVLTFTQLDPTINRLWLRIPAKKDEYVWGCGQQMSYFNADVEDSRSGLRMDALTDLPGGDRVPVFPPVI